MSDANNARRSESHSDLVFEKVTWTVADVARELNCSIRTVRKLVHEDRIPYAKVGGLVRFSRLRIHEWLLKGGNR
jgi:excisionase family DNA binding protein